METNAHKPARAAWLPILLLILFCGQRLQAAAISTYVDLAAAVATGAATNFASATVIGYSTSQQTLQITKNTVIDGGTNNVIIDGSLSTRLFVVHTNCQLILANLQLRHGLGGNGGAILNSGELIISNCIFEENIATNLNGAAGVAATTTNSPDGTAGGAGGSIWGGAIYSFGPLYVYNSLFESNSATAGNGGNGGAGVNTTGTVHAGVGGNGGNGGDSFGGAIFCSGSNAVISGSEFLGNWSYGGNAGLGGAIGSNPNIAYGGASGQGGQGGDGRGGAMYMTGSIAVSNCIWVGNIAYGGNSQAAQVAFNGNGFSAYDGGVGLGGGLFVTTASKAASLQNAIFYGNICVGGGGGNSSANNQFGGNGGDALGGGLYVAAVSAALRNCTLATNYVFGGTNGIDTGTNGAAGSAGAIGGVDVYCGAGVTKLANSILAGPAHSSFGVTDAGYNICSDQSLVKVAATTRLATPPRLDSGLSYQGPPLGPIGGPQTAELTLAVLAGPATNVIPGVPGITFPATDERGQARGTPATIGAFEVHTIAPASAAPPTITAEPQNQIAVIGKPATFAVTVATNANDANPVGYQWQLNGVNLPNGGNFQGANSATMTILDVVQADLGAYQVIVGSSTLDSVTNSGLAYLLVKIPTAITAQPASVHAPDGAVVNFKVKVSGSPPFYYQWRSNGVPLTDGDEFSGSQTTNLTINPATFTDAASYTVVITNFYHSVTSAVAKLTIATDKAKPTVVITAPKPNARTTTNAIYGTTTDNAQVTGVMVWITNIVAGVTNVTSTPAIVSATGTTVKTWSVTNALAAGTNIVAAQATDFAGNVSTIVSRKLFYVVPSFFTLSYNGPGSALAKAPFVGMEPPTNGAMLEVGQGYTLVASPDPSCLLTNWTSTAFTSYSNTLHFTMTPNLAVTANFVISPYLGVAGGYSALFFETNGDFNPATWGMLSGMMVSKLGAYSGKLSLGAAAYPLTGAFDIFGHASNYIARAAAKGGPLGVALDLHAANEQLTGAVSGLSAHWMVPLAGEANAAANTAGSSESTLLLSPTANGAGDAPPGFGFLLLTNHSGTVTWSGALADGTALSGSAPLGVLGFVPLYASLYNHTGTLIGWLSLSNGVPTAPQGLAWTRPGSSKSVFYPAGFTNFLGAQGSRWVNDPTFTAGGTMVVSNSSVNETIPIAIRGGVVSGSPFPKGTVTAKTGLVKMTLSSGIGNATLPGAGAILQNTGFVGGYFLTKTNAGILIGP